MLGWSLEVRTLYIWKFFTENSTSHLSDTGVGMTEDELRKNLGTIARSGTNEFLSKFDSTSEAPKKDADSISSGSSLIGQVSI
jgi:HSP90 family molecular chaperone